MAFSGLGQKQIYSGGDGSSEDQAVLIQARSSTEGVEAEYEYVKKLYGIRGMDWELNIQEFYTSEAERKIDVLKLRLENGSFAELYFDITEFFGK